MARSGSRSGAARSAAMVSTAPIVIEAMTAEDIDAVQEIERASFPVPWPANAFRHELTQNRNARYIVAREGERVVGYAGLWLQVDEAHITTFAVLPEHRRRRIGEQLLQRLFEIGAELGAEWLTLEVRASNIAAQRLYEKYGFRRAGVRRRYYSDNSEDALIMWTERLKDRAVRDRLEQLRRSLGE
ncbi:MAG: ribosomal protein S18-alanine N-acetyltransferase [Candidatus Limnocylindria bacterium]